MPSFAPSTTAIAGSVPLSALVGILPLLVFFVLLGVFKMKTHWCAVGALAVAAMTAVVGFGMPAGMVGLSALQGLAFGIAPILYIVIAAVWLYNLTVTSGRAKDVRAVFSAVGKGDTRIQALLVGYSFCALLEGLAGFGAPVAIVAAMLVTLGVSPLKAAAVTMVGNSISVGFGAMAIPVTTGGRIGDVPATELATTMASVTPWVATLMPFLLLVILDGVRGIRQLWHIGLVQGLTVSLGHLVATNFISYELTAVFAALLSFGAVALLLSAVTPSTPIEHRSESVGEMPSGSRIGLALLPYGIVVFIFAVAKLWTIGINIPTLLASTDVQVEWPGLYGSLLTASGEVSPSAIYNLQSFSSPGTMIVISALIVSFVYGRWTSRGQFEFSFRRGIAVLGETVVSLRWSLLTIALVMSLAYVMNFSGQTMAIGAALASTGAAFAFLSPILGWIGTAVTGSATSANALFADMQVTAAAGAGLQPEILLAANTIGGGIGKIVSPQNLAIVATSVAGSAGSVGESEILRKVAPWSLGLLLLLCILIFLATQSVLPII